MENKITDINRMLNSFENASSYEERFDLAAKYWNELAMGYHNIEKCYVSKENGIYVEEKDPNNKYVSIDDFVKKAAKSQKRLEKLDDSGYVLNKAQEKEYEDFIKYIRCLIPYIVNKDVKDNALRKIRYFGWTKPARIERIKWEMDWFDQVKGTRDPVKPMWDIYDPKNHIIPEPESINKNIDVRAKLINLIGEMIGYRDSMSLYWTALEIVKQELNTILLGDILSSKK